MEKFFKYPRVIVGVVALITVFFGLQLPKVQMDNNIMAFIPDTLPEHITASHFEAEYGDSITIMVGLERPYGTVFESAFLSRIKAFGEAVEAKALVKSVESIMSTEYITSDSESIMVTGLVSEDFTGTEEEIAELKRRIASWDMYEGALISEDLRAAQIVVQLNAPSDRAGDRDVVAVLMEIREMAKEMFAPYAVVYTAGQAVITATLTESAFADLVYLIPFTILVLLAVLTLSFRRLSFVAYPLLTVIIAVLWSIGAMPLFGVKMTLLEVILPIILMAVGSAYGVHVVSHYKDEIQGKTLSAAEHRVFVLGLVRKLLKPVFLAGLTTFAGFVSFCFAPMSTMRDFGIFSSFGVLSAFAIAIALIPAILLIRGSRGIKPAGSKHTQKRKPGFNFENQLVAAMSAIAKKKSLVLAAAALVIIVSIAGAFKIVVDNSLVEFFSKDSEVTRSDRFIREHFGGSSQLIVSVEADDTQTLLNPEVLAALDGLSAYLMERVPKVGKVTGFTDMVKRMNQMFNVDEPPDGIRGVSRITAGDTLNGELEFGDFGFEAAIEEGQNNEQINDRPLAAPAFSGTPVTFAMINAAAGKNGNMNARSLVRELERMTNYEGRAYYEIPAVPARYGKETPQELQQLISNYLILLAGNAENSFSNDPLEPTAIETIVLVNSQWQADAQEVTRAINDYAAAHFPENVRVLVGGGAAQEGALVRLVVQSQTISIFVSVLMVLLIVAFSYKSLAAGIIAALPLAIAIMCNFGIMGFFGITLNVSTAMIASLAVGIGIDYTIHIIEAVKREYAAGGDYMRRAFGDSGKAILINAVSVGCSFGVLFFSRFRIIAQFGALISLSMILSAVVSLTVVPVLITTVKPKFIYGSRSVK
ncbi:antibiotic transporter [Spirochaetia bacterium]|nr:antibiotic transporter [Spirochaetia bacterium]